MNCDCKTEIENRLLDRLKESFPDSTEHSALLDGYALVMQDGTMRLKPAMSIKASHVDIKGKLKNIPKQNMMFSYCPFCGQKLNN